MVVTDDNKTQKKADEEDEDEDEEMEVSVSLTIIADDIIISRSDSCVFSVTLGHLSRFRGNE